MPRLRSASAVAAAVALVGLTLTDDVVVLALLSAAAGLGLGLGQPLSMTMAVCLAPEYARAIALAVRLTVNRIGQAGRAAGGRRRRGKRGCRSVFWLVSAMLVASALVVRRPALADAAD